MVRVLVLVDQDVAEPPPVDVARPSGTPGTGRPSRRSGRRSRARWRRAAGALVLPEDVDEHALVRVARVRLARVGLGVGELVLELRDPGLGAAGVRPKASASSSLTMRFDHARESAGVVDGERRREARTARPRAAGCARTPSGTWRSTCPARGRRPAASTRSRISAAALLVNVIARIWLGHASPRRAGCAMRWVSTRVLPEPAPATMSSGRPRYSTASRCSGFSPSVRRELAVADGAEGASRQPAGSSGSRISVMSHQV